VAFGSLHLTDAASARQRMALHERVEPGKIALGGGTRKRRDNSRWVGNPYLTGAVEGLPVIRVRESTKGFKGQSF
jgi:hypothetical protein